MLAKATFYIKLLRILFRYKMTVLNNQLTAGQHTASSFTTLFIYRNKCKSIIERIISIKRAFTRNKKNYCVQLRYRLLVLQKRNSFGWLPSCNRSQSNKNENIRRKKRMIKILIKKSRRSIIFVAQLLINREKQFGLFRGSIIFAASYALYYVVTNTTFNKHVVNYLTICRFQWCSTLDPTWHN